MENIDINSVLPDEREHLYNHNGLKKFVNLVRTSLNDLGICHLQFNCQDKETLLDAQEKPENYPTLMVRVAGYSVYFTDLAKCVQDDVISRTEHKF
jgi:pyruvate-formate lyase